MNVLLLMAGSSDLFKEAGFPYPRSLIEIRGEPLIQHVIQGLKPLYESSSRFICLVRRDENRRHHVGMVIQLLLPKAKVVEINSSTGGAACTALLAVDEIGTDEPLLIVNGDQVISANLNEVIADFHRRRLDAGTITFEAVHPRWSYVRCNAEGLVIEAAEKRPISKLATAGFYYFASGKQFVSSAKGMIRKNANVDGAFYVCPVFNEMLLSQARIGTFSIPRWAYFSLATPKNVADYEEHLSERHRA